MGLEVCRLMVDDGGTKGTWREEPLLASPYMIGPPRSARFPPLAIPTLAESSSGPNQTPVSTELRDP
jgi:hypothetical protein